MLSWSEGSYERTAQTLEPAASRAVDALGAPRGLRVVDLGCGTGNAAIEAARRGAKVLAVEPAERLAEVCRMRARELGLDVDVQAGDAARIPASDGAFDALVSVFAVIFAPDAEVAVKEMLRVVRPGGRVVVTSWVPRGPIAEAGALLRAAMASLAPPDAAAATSKAGERPAPAWGDPAFVRGIFQAEGAAVAIEEGGLVFEAESPEAWFDEQAENHPIWRGVRLALDARPGDWGRLRERSVAALSAGSETSPRFRTTSGYLLITASRA